MRIAFYIEGEKQADAGRSERGEGAKEETAVSGKKAASGKTTASGERAGYLLKEDRYAAFSDEKAEEQRRLLQRFLYRFQSGCMQATSETDGSAAENPAAESPKEYLDPGSFPARERPALLQLLRDAGRGEIRVVLMASLKCLGAENEEELRNYLECVFPFVGLRVVALQEHYDSGDRMDRKRADGFGFRCLAAERDPAARVAEKHRAKECLDPDAEEMARILYSREASDRSRAGMERKWQQGIHTQGRVPFGYRKKENRSCEVDEKAAAIVRHMFQMAAGGAGTRRIAERLNEDRIPTPGQYQKGNQLSVSWVRRVPDAEWLWNGRMVWKILKNPVYMGSKAEMKAKKAKETENSERVGKRSQLEYPAYPAIVSPSEFEAAQQIFVNRGKKGFALDSGFSLRGKVRCGNCRLAMTYDASAAEPVIYCSHGISAGSASHCPKIRYPAAWLEALVYAEIEKRVEEIRKNDGKTDEEWQLILDKARREAGGRMTRELAETVVEMVYVYGKEKVEVVMKNPM